MIDKVEHRNLWGYCFSVNIIHRHSQRAAWVLNGFIPSNQEEAQILKNIKNQLNFDPCEESHRLRSNSWEEPERIRNPKVVLQQLINNNKLREQKCWEETSLELLQKRGRETGLEAYLQEIEQRLIPVITSPDHS